MIYKWTISVLFLMASFSVNSVEQQMAEVNSAAKLKIVTTFSILADLFKNVGGQYVEVHTLVDWDEDAHVFHPSPADVRRLTKADLLVLNGLGFEGWLERLISSSNFNGKLVTAASGVDVIKRLEDKESDHHDHHNLHFHAQTVQAHELLLSLTESTCHPVRNRFDNAASHHPPAKKHDDCLSDNSHGQIMSRRQSSQS